MLLHLEPGSSVPLYQQIVDEVRRLVTCGALRPKDRLPTVRELAVMARVNRNTAARAVKTLEAQGIVTTQVGRGTFVSDVAGARSEAFAKKRIEAALERLLAEARGLGVGADQVLGWLEERVERAPPKRGSRGAGGKRKTRRRTGA